MSRDRFFNLRINDTPDTDLIESVDSATAGGAVTVGDGTSLVYVTGGAVATAVTIPDAALFPSRQITVAADLATAPSVTLVSAGGAFSGAADLSANAPFRHFVSDGTDWLVINTVV